MTAVYRFELPGGGVVLAEGPAAATVERAARRPTVLQDTTVSFETALAGVRDAAAAALAQFRSMPACPNEIELKFGVKLDAKVGAVIVQTGVEGHFEVRLLWAPP